ncbi:DUF4083 family protein [Peribacillus sp. SI8-4]|uniref:DUF4083 family protein n=1 Tax=Peribacillus sp. SI8-4 TaxID=3048009 RepID=UPI002557520A|nr:DUF4083 family protein [Peribacillus sp. SI8-4]
MYQIVIFIMVAGIFSAVYFFIRNLVTGHTSKSGNAEQKLDRIIELLEKDKK